ncbi:MAG: carboxypeptidase-like regulatory domain-containing protein, partial [Sediminibacterium sp.]|nr:carboxypeptidase-like regulatory domain-containing protein [Sediminibacterium sp.]
MVFCLYIFNVNATIVKGFVADSLSQKPLAFASLFIKGTSFSTISQQDGSFEFSLPPGNYIIVCKYVNYLTKETPITVTNNSPLITINLTSITFS